MAKKRRKTKIRFNKSTNLGFLAIFLAAIPYFMYLSQEKRFGPQYAHFWELKEWYSKETVDRILPESSELITFLSLSNQAKGIHQYPSEFTLKSDDINLLKGIILELPDNLKKLLNKKLTGIVVVKDLGFSSDSHIVFNQKEEMKYGFIVLDAGLFSMNSNQWMSTRSLKAFKMDDSGQVFTIKLSRDESSNKASVRYFILKEIAKIQAFLNHSIPYSANLMGADTNISKFDFLNFSWEAKNIGASIWDNEFSYRKFLNFLSNNKSKIRMEYSDSVFEQWNKTNFVNLKASTNPIDDFAESFAQYIHIFKYHENYSIELTKNNKVIKTYESCWKTQRCEKKKAFFESYTKQ